MRSFYLRLRPSLPYTKPFYFYWMVGLFNFQLKITLLKHIAKFESVPTTSSHHPFLRIIALFWLMYPLGVFLWKFSYAGFGISQSPALHDASRLISEQIKFPNVVPSKLIQFPSRDLRKNCSAYEPIFRRDSIVLFPFESL